ncbi:MAG: IS110 family transposase [Acidiferrobacterales bacterium]
MNQLADTVFTAYVGIDWADAKHDICVQAADSGAREFDCISSQPEGIDAWACALYQRFGGPIAVALELCKGPIVSALQKYDFFVLYPINPLMLARYREAFTPSRAKDDPSDAALAVDLITRHPERFEPLKPQSVTMRKLIGLVEQRRKFAADQGRVVNRLGHALKQYYPQVLEWFSEHNTVVFCDFLTQWPTLTQAKRARRTRLERFFKDHNVRFGQVIEERITAIKAAMPLTLDPAVIEPHRLQVEILIEQLRVTIMALKRFDDEIAATVQQLPDYALLFRPLPGAGHILAPRLLAAFGEDRERYRHADELQMYAGIAPVTERSGKKSWVRWRWQCPTFIRQTFVEWAAQTINKSAWAGAYYRQQRAKGCTYQVAVRALAFKWIRILYRCWQDRTPYDESKYLEALRRKGSPLLKYLAEPA